MNSFPGKILLFGEYTLLYNQQALAMPFSKFSGKWRLESKPKNSPDLSPWATYIQNCSSKHKWMSPIAIDVFKADIQQGLWFDSSIPQGYGLGSSGALVAAWYSKYIEKKSGLELKQLKDRLALLESFFHGTSSGFDPLVSYLNKPILQQGEQFAFLEEERSELLEHFFILDTGISRTTEPLVKWFKKKMGSDKIFEEKAMPHLMRAQKLAIDSFAQGDLNELLNAFSGISFIQLETMSKLIPKNIATIWDKGFEHQQYFMKLCGAGGGGVMLGIGELPETDLDSYRLL